MSKDCGCKGSICGCTIKSGTGITVTGTGTASNPFVISRDTTGDTVFRQVKVGNTTTFRAKITGTGTVADPVVISGDVIVVAPNGSFWKLAVSNTGVLSTTSTVAP
jgi:hypothetical protein